MTEKNSQILDAAQSVFARYGVSKTTMNDIAREAGIARQTLYNKYPGKSEVLRACVRQYGDTCLLYTSPSPRDATLSRMPSSA